MKTCERHDNLIKVDNSLFDPRDGLNRGRSKGIEALWYFIKIAFFLSALPWPSLLKVLLLRAFGAHIGTNVYIKPRVNIHFPWKLHIGDNTWIGEEAWLLNFEDLYIGRNCCISQRAFICCGNHDYRTVNMRYRNRPIRIEDGAWVGAQVFVGPGVIVGRESVIMAGSTVSSNTADEMICGGAPCQSIRPRWH